MIKSSSSEQLGLETPVRKPSSSTSLGLETPAVKSSASPSSSLKSFCRVPRHRKVDFCCPLDEDNHEDDEEKVDGDEVDDHVQDDVDVDEHDDYDVDEGQDAKRLFEPQLPSPDEIARHNLSHLPFRSWCPDCVAG